MSTDTKTVNALSQILNEINANNHRPIPAKLIRALEPLTGAGKNLVIDIDASQLIGAPLITLVEDHSDNNLLLKLTPRQKQVAELIIKGRSNRKIAEELAISITTVKDHVHAILDRLNLPSRIALITAFHSKNKN